MGTTDLNNIIGFLEIQTSLGWSYATNSVSVDFSAKVLDSNDQLILSMLIDFLVIVHVLCIFLTTLSMIVRF